MISAYYVLAGSLFLACLVVVVAVVYAVDSRDKARNDEPTREALGLPGLTMFYDLTPADMSQL